MSLDISRINQEDLTVDQYFKEDCSLLKKQIVIHFTAGSESAANTIHGWQFKPERVGTAFVISRGTKTEKDGEIFQAFGSKYWAFHIAFSKNTNKVPVKYHSFDLEKKIAKASIGIEICNWGGLIKDKDGNFRNYLNGIVPSDEVIELDSVWRGFKYFHAYSDAQIASLKNLIIYLCEKYNIPKKFNADMFDINLRALEGESGIFTHVSYRSDKSDSSKQPKLIKMLEEIELGV